MNTKRIMQNKNLGIFAILGIAVIDIRPIYYIYSPSMKISNADRIF